MVTIVMCHSAPESYWATFVYKLVLCALREGLQTFDLTTDVALSIIKGQMARYRRAPPPTGQA